MSIKPWNSKQLFRNPQTSSAEAELQAALSQGHLYQTEGEKIYKIRPRQIKAIWIEGDVYKGKPTRHFAWIGLPDIASTGKKKVPGIVLVHGGGGTAFLRWVETWNRRGYAAIAVDTCGNLPIANKYGQWLRHQYSHNSTWGDFGNIANPVNDQWCYHAITAVVRAHSYLRGLQEVNCKKTGITGVSWGGYLTSIASAIDPRFRFAAPVYGCGFLDLDSPWQHDYLDKLPKKLKTRWLKLWDPSVYLPKARIPILWTTGSNDFAYNLRMLEHSRAICGSKGMLSIHVRYKHSHNHAWNLKEPYTFADSFCLNGQKLNQPRIRIKGDQIIVTGKNIVQATLCSTKDNCRLPDRYWKQNKMKKDKTSSFYVNIPTNITGWFINITDFDKNLTSSNIFLEP